jgi:hypothetical protein
VVSLVRRSSNFSISKRIEAIFHGHDHDEDDVKEQHGHFIFSILTSPEVGAPGTMDTESLRYLKNGQIVTYQMNPKPMKKVNNTQIE